MLYPSIDLLMEKLDSKYTLVTVAAKRARQLQEKEDLTIENPVSKKFVGKALEEIAAGHIELAEEEK
ncbi:DNA-directed RNA polymerase subunit omega [Thermaerobacillus caldiproteolyticus]|uniref:DNA-directed RNA polymerase subunit omega n=1 Tax=Thermaerobacillus caldiproteolyticus TaxID=247480 RepID=A0A7W0BZ23_9BACL|nr:DNA-directed RNA polymerase subunit omega [Anoxybacillus caldiproteolyticus]MBA2874046.1 DNA-directed RNA polymerase subunit omega [Anoxybacillus caldiproteolyticus]QPA32000.1 DNA-directed RNA polymerase subunit omega [Anoxybacillus caldiproteolyticus]